MAHEPNPSSDKDKDKTVWMKCRGKRGCENNHARIVREFSLPAGGKSIRYRCTKCGRPFHIVF